jgi:hypothetical protein
MQIEVSEFLQQLQDCEKRLHIAIGELYEVCMALQDASDRGDLRTKIDEGQELWNARDVRIADPGVCRLCGGSYTEGV